MHDLLSLCELAKLEVVGKNDPVHVLFLLEEVKEITSVLFFSVHVIVQSLFSEFVYIFFLFLFFFCTEWRMSDGKISYLAEFI